MLHFSHFFLRVIRKGFVLRAAFADCFQTFSQLEFNSQIYHDLPAVGNYNSQLSLKASWIVLIFITFICTKKFTTFSQFPMKKIVDSSVNSSCYLCRSSSQSPWPLPEEDTSSNEKERSKLVYEIPRGFLCLACKTVLHSTNFVNEQ